MIRFECRLALMLLIATTISLSGCMSYGGYNPNAPFDPSRHSIYVIGFKEENMHLMVGYGKLKEGGVDVSTSKGANVWSRPKDGYLISKISKDDILTITKIEKNYEPVSMQAEGRWGPCQGSEAIYFSSEPGKVVYITDVVVEEVEGKLIIRYKSDIEGAKDFLHKYYPKLANKIVQGDYSFAPSARSCNPRPGIFILTI